MTCLASRRAYWRCLHAGSTPEAGISSMGGARGASHKLDLDAVIKEKESASYRRRASCVAPRPRRSKEKYSSGASYWRLARCAARLEEFGSLARIVLAAREVCRTNVMR